MTIKKARPIPGTWTRIVAGSLAALSFAACERGETDGDGGLSPGHEGRVSFGYDRSCFFECSIEQPLLVGTRERIVVDDAGDAEGLEASTLDTDIVEIAFERGCHCEREDGSPGRLEIADDASCESPWRKKCNNEFVVAALAEGDALLELRDRAGELVDAVDLHVREAERASFFATYPDELGTVETDSVELATFGRVDVEVELYDADGLVLLAPEGVAWHSDDGDVAEVAAWLIATGVDVEAGLAVAVEARGEGETTVHVVVPGLDATLDVAVSAP